ncbi:probable ATP-dependent RNA helicase spindle-E [Condylostylus longicornis]|uniref:probable ATP-dependent RNA helicase spindle-E n=1 Tax=Condylostylus longicornis TaxID=2530218 RepID=UPI00244DC4CD|nr:probable ATP-dependent RNA helicase spindle-E [Condylostylus longicornis]XP_055384478.1 probable ATP-dependent RNA helicase spindle-E [Condylostylus longicornis]
MDDINDFFDFSKPFKRTVVSGGCVNGRCMPDETFRSEVIPKREVIGKEYSKKLAVAEEINVLEDDYAVSAGPSSGRSSNISRSFMETMEDDTDEDINMDKKPKDDIYEKYNFSKRTHIDLPIFDTREDIIELIHRNRVVVLEGETGCGKTTQLPQFILDDAYKNREYCNIVCTQPRRIAAISIAQRVAEERNWKVGTIVGYQVGLHKELNPDTRLLYCTTGVLLQKLIKAKDLASYTHIILDEVHERDQDMDFLLIVIKKLIRKAPDTKIILMSATIDTKAFSEYFKTVRGKILIPAPVLKVDTRRLYNVKIFYIEDLSKITDNENFRIDYDTPGISDSLHKVVLKLIINLEILDKSDSESQELAHKPSILIFLPGINEIDKMENVLEGLRTLIAVQMNVSVIRLHSMISPEEQQKAFRNPAPGYRKIILATNIAESSITVPDVKYVIDFCLTKNLVTDTSSNLTSLQLQWASKANCKQRAGRAGRVMNGRVFRLVTKDFYNLHMPEQSSPEMTRCPLENIVLKAKMLDMGPPNNILGLALDPPNLSDIRNTILTLKEVGALFSTINGTYDVDDADLTFVGRVMAQLPIDIHLSRLIIFGYIFSILEETIIIAAGLNVKSIFDFPYQAQLSAYSSKLTWSDGSGSDLFAIISAYRVWLSKYEQGQFKNENAEAAWSRRFYINSRSMKEMHYLVLELKSRLQFIGIKENTGAYRVNWLDHERAIALKVAIAGAFYPNYFLRATIDQYESEKGAYQTLCGRNPCNTVYFTGFDNKYIGEFYVKSIKDIFKKAMIAYKNIEVEFEEGTQKIFVKFNRMESYSAINNVRLALPGRVQPEVYKAVKMRQLHFPATIKVMPARDIAVYASEKNLGQIVDGKFEFYKHNIKEAELIVLPSVFTRFERGRISYIENCGKFWFRPKQVENQLKHIVAELNNNESLYKFASDNQVSRGMIVAAKHKGKFFRAKILRREEESKLSNIRFRVIFIDYGDVLSISLSDLYGINQNHQNSVLVDLPPRVFECYLAGIAPSAINCTSGHWIEHSTNYFKDVMKQEYEKNKEIVLEIYSVVNGICATFVHIGSETINDILVEKNFAQYCEENYMSKIDNDLRTRKQFEQRYKNFENFSKNQEDERAFLEDYIRQSEYGAKNLNLDPPPDNKCTIKLNLRGPLSPLETTCFSATRIGTYKTVRIERDSVNCVLLNSDPQDGHERMIVAASINESVEKDTITARQTSLMPNIKGFAPLMVLMFSPKMEMRRNKNKTRFSSILCGLGSHENDPRRSLFPEHDILLNLNVEISENDIEIINKIRFCMDSILFTNAGEEFPANSQKERYNFTARVKQLLIQLLEKDRQYIECEQDFNGTDWNQVESKDMRAIKNIYMDRSIFPLHDHMRLYNEPYQHVENLRKNCKLLHEYKRIYTNATISGNNIRCELCGQNLNDIMQLRIHLLSKLHKDREKQIDFKP